MNNPSDTSRRQFLKTTGSAAMGGLLAAPFIVPGKSFGAETNSDTLKVGLVGCGGRGSGAAKQALMADKNVILTAVGDAFEDRMKSSLNALRADQEVSFKVKVDPDHCFVGLDAYQKVIDSGVDVVVLATPPGFRPQHLKAAIAAGKHVFFEKPVAVDAPGIRMVLEAAAEAKRKKLSMVCGFCWRYNLAEKAAFTRVLDGDIGKVQAVYSTYLTGFLWHKPRLAGTSDLEWQMRNWLYHAWLSGDHIVEQAVHSVDKLHWAFGDKTPLKAVALGGRQVRTEPAFGHIYDHFAVAYTYPNDAKGILFCRQQGGCASDNSDVILGTKGNCRILGFNGMPYITGEKAWKYRGERPDMYQLEHNELFASIRSGAAHNDGEWAAHSSLMAIMGRMAGYTGQEITWEQALNSEEKLAPDIIDFKNSIDVAPVAMPGVTKFI